MSDLRRQFIPPVNMSNKEAKKVNLIGFLCPIPVHETRRILEKCERGQVIEVVCDDPETLHDIPALCDRMGTELVKVEESSGEFTFVISA
jgi:TusA-related sulfurtransferase